LKGGRRIGETKEHDGRFKKSLRGKEGSLPFVPLLDTDVIVSPPDVEFGKQGTSTETVDCLWDEGGDVAVLLGPLIDRAIVLYRPQLSILLLDKKEVSGVWAPRFTNCSSA
jgi:hypothetical protein